MSTQVPGSGPPDARIAFIGEAPGSDETSEGRPFVGPSGRLLNEMLASVGIARGECYVDNVMQVQPPRNDFGVFYEGRGCPSKMLIEGRERLLTTLERIKPNVIVPLGNEALVTLTGKRGIDKWRGSIIDTRWGKVVPTYHPAYVLRMYETRVIVEHDLARAREESTRRECVLPKHEFIIWPSFDATMDYLRGIKHGTRTAFDIETIDRRVRCLGLATSPSSALCIPFMSHGGMRPGDTRLLVAQEGSGYNSHWPEEHEMEILRELDRVLGDPEIPLIAQNFPFDSSLLAREFGLVCRGLWMDTMVAQHCVYSELPKGLDFLASIYTRVPYWSDYDAQSDDATWVYNAHDASVTYEVALALDRELKGD